MKHRKIKEQLVTFIIEDLEDKIQTYKEAMEKAQEEANCHIGAMASRYDTFKEEAQMLKDGFARQLNIAHDLLNKSKLYKNRVLSCKNDDTYVVKFGSYIKLLLNKETEANYFIFYNLITDSINIDNIQYTIISPEAPICKVLLDKKVADKFDFRDRSIEILEIF